MQVVSVSRRTDIPNYYGEWFISKIKEGFAYSKNPFNQKSTKVSLEPKDIMAFVFWSKNFEPFLPYLKIIEKDYYFYLHYTITALPKTDFEQKSPSIKQSIETFKHLSDKYSKENIIWRFDPICLSRKTPLVFYKEAFDFISSELANYTNTCYFSFVQTNYRKVERQFKKKNIILSDNFEEEKELLEFMLGCLEKRRITLKSCCQPQYTFANIEKGTCIDKQLIYSINPVLQNLEKTGNCFSLNKSPTRKYCGCYKSIDIGLYDSCLSGCIYCYASSNTKNKDYFLDKRSLSCAVFNY